LYIIIVIDYFGEKVAYYFLFLGHYTSWLFVAAIVGIGAWANIAVNNNDPNAPVIPYYSGFMALWATCFLESWKRKEAWYAMIWGTIGFQEEEQARPQFKGELTSSPVDGEDELYFSVAEKSSRSLQSLIVISIAICFVIAVVASLFLLRLTMVKYHIRLGTTEIGPILTSVIQAIVIAILDYIYGFIATALNDFENHRTDTEYEDNLIAKVLVFLH
jgi:hypothetical protein